MDGSTSQDGSPSQDGSSAEIAELRAQLSRAMNGTIGVKNPKPEVLDSAQEAAFATSEQLAGAEGEARDERFGQIGDDLPGDLRAWLLELPSFLSKKGRAEVGHRLCDTFAPLLGDLEFEAERAAVRYEAGEKEEAEQALAGLLERSPAHPWILLRSAQLSVQSGEHRRARKQFDEALEASKAGGDEEERRFVYNGYVDFLHEHGETGESLEMSRRMMEDLPHLEEEFRTEQIVNEAPKVGRNDPCPCGSGKKYKKCCAR